MNLNNTKTASDKKPNSLCHKQEIQFGQCFRNLILQLFDNYFNQFENNESEAKQLFAADKNLYEIIKHELEEVILQSALNYNKQNQVKTAKVLGISRASLLKKMKQYHLQTKKEMMANLDVKKNK